MWRTSITLVFCALLIGCGDDTKYQAELRGTWLLESRKSAQGEIVQSPQISGLIEWFPTTPTQAKVHLSVTDDRTEHQSHRPLIRRSRSSGHDIYISIQTQNWRRRDRQHRCSL